MTKSQYPFPPDEFDVRGPEGAPVGVHREPRSGWSSVWPFLLVAVVFAGLGVGIISFLSDGGDTPTDNPPVASEQSASAEGSGEGEGSEGEGSGEEPTDGSGDEGDEGEGAEGDESEEPSEEPSDEAAEMPGDPAAADLSARVVVWNDISGAEAAGQAGATADLVTGAGFADVGALDAPAAPVTLAGVYDETTVLFADGRADTATAVAEAVGAAPANVQLSDDLTNSPTDAVWVIIKEPVG
ncbi:LytR C-terminal domain-containing protein [Isoptericola sp. S6320L]|uniref:LytR C-terminal domain-containing protein n=1 Tax=Isoptericola sp. S6320L TaxID=2926411 RepID=UPI001FF469E3|nr:LytR C-terminal domain-containing protein [Isoptericola sp. S6320L]MCK0116328.1 LytR C-terminal domain-containing protein [Isoptericola sp. S6320L]